MGLHHWIVGKSASPPSSTADHVCLLCPEFSHQQGVRFPDTFKAKAPGCLCTGRLVSSVKTIRNFCGRGGARVEFWIWASITKGCSITMLSAWLFPPPHHHHTLFHLHGLGGTAVGWMRPVVPRTRMLTFHWLNLIKLFLNLTLLENVLEKNTNYFLTFHPLNLHIIQNTFLFLAM